MERIVGVHGQAHELTYVKIISVILALFTALFLMWGPLCYQTRKGVHGQKKKLRTLALQHDLNTFLWDFGDTDYVYIDFLGAMFIDMLMVLILKDCVAIVVTHLLL